MLIDPYKSGAGRRVNPELVQCIKNWVTEALHTTEETTILVTEMRCTTPDCPPIKTVIALLREGEPAHQYKIHKPLDEISHLDVLQLTSMQPKIKDSL